MTRNTFFSTLESNAIARKNGRFYETRREVAKGDQAYLNLPGDGIVWCRVLDVWTETLSGEVSADTPFNLRRAEVVIRGGKRLVWDTANLVKRAA